jgi:hypothetical protein
MHDSVTAAAARSFGSIAHGSSALLGSLWQQWLFQSRRQSAVDVLSAPPMWESSQHPPECHARRLLRIRAHHLLPGASTSWLQCTLFDLRSLVRALISCQKRRASPVFFYRWVEMRVWGWRT